MLVATTKDWQEEEEEEEKEISVGSVEFGKEWLSNSRENIISHVAAKSEGFREIGEPKNAFEPVIAMKLLEEKGTKVNEKMFIVRYNDHQIIEKAMIMDVGPNAQTHFKRLKLDQVKVKEINHVYNIVKLLEPSKTDMITYVQLEYWVVMVKKANLQKITSLEI
ncbi:hypothetical protein SELMODRAFT_432439 [Selaginella moellendorffii]|uniref:Uncharacterized protein n=1 Tax=Selaginella moellendorffii TaxID=88036 RepID=D8TG03_SELML|nr:hypothetical protein SELMODRAFT_432439 [Selaginella moellendorffii]